VKKRWGLVIDQERCIGCEACTIACKLENNGNGGWVRVETENAPGKDLPAGCFPRLHLTFLPRLCNHCDSPPCVEACPEEAIVKREDGIVMLDHELCTGCQLCLPACPYDALTLNEDGTKAEKCNLCLHRIEQDLAPFCVICCEGQAMHFGNLNDPESRISQMVARQEAFLLEPEAGTGPGVYYLPPKPQRPL